MALLFEQTKSPSLMAVHIGMYTIPGTNNQVGSTVCLTSPADDFLSFLDHSFSLLLHVRV